MKLLLLSNALFIHINGIQYFLIKMRHKLEILGQKEIQQERDNRLIAPVLKKRG
jgi:hypothetical protein